MDKRKACIFIVWFLCSLVLLNSLIASEENEQKQDYDLGRIVVIPDRWGVSEVRLSSNITVIDNQKIKASNAKYVADIIKEEAGINIYDNSSDKTAKVDIRGFADTSVSNVLVLVDGRRVNSIDISGPDWIQMPVEVIERIEILKGAGSVLYGDNAVGGVVNIVTKKGEGRSSGRIGVAGGSYNTQEEDLEFSGSDKNLSYYFYSKYYETDGYRKNSDLLSKDYNTRIGYNLGERLNLSLMAGLHRDDYGMPGGLDNIIELDQYGRRGSTEENDFASTKDRYIKFSLDASPQLKDIELGNFVVDVFYRNKDAYSWFYYGGFPTATKYMIDTRGITAKGMFNKDISGKEFKFISGIDYYDTEHRINGSEWSSDDLTIYKKELGAYIYSEYEMMDKFFLNVGARNQKVKYRFDQRSPSSLYEAKSPGDSVFMGGIKYEYAEGSNLHLGIQETFRFLATDEWYSTWTGLNTGLKQQSGVQYEAGIKHNFGNIFLLNLTPYIMDIKNEIYVNPDPSPGRSENYDKTRRKGLELGIDVDVLKLLHIALLDKMELSANYTYQDPEFRG
ncbi:MAG: TonB-dependent receptor, partial [Candidatus Omnitrophica bacterium]|nr:TonB-dependent receptor [Candidatus Omnitrophota bacterium]